MPVVARIDERLDDVLKKAANKPITINADHVNQWILVLPKIKSEMRILANGTIRVNRRPKYRPARNVAVVINATFGARCQRVRNKTATAIKLMAKNNFLFISQRSTNLLTHANDTN